MMNDRTTKSKMTKAEAIKLIVSVGLSIEIIHDFNIGINMKEYIYCVGVRFAKLSHVVLYERANSAKFAQSFGELRRLNNQLKEYRTSPK